MSNTAKNKPSFFIRLLKTAFLISIFCVVIWLFYLISSRIVKFTTKTNDYLKIANYLRGEDKPVKNLVLFSNNAEQRFGGGFIGSVGLVEADKAKFKVEPIHSVYYYDKNTTGKPSIYELPDELKGLTSSLALRDSAIFANWPDSALLAAKFFRQESGQDVDNVISVTPEFLKEMLKITGPVTLNDYHKQIDANNFLDTVQLEVESGSDKKSGKDPKTILSVLADTLVDRLLNDDSGKAPKYYDLIKKMIVQKQLVIYSFDPRIQQKIEENNMGGRLAEASGNYLLVAGANVGANKSSPFIDQTVEQDLEIDQKGEATAKLKITRKHNSDYKYFYFDTNMSENKWLIGDNAQYQEVFLPLGSKLLSSSISLQNIKQYSQDNKTVFAFMQNTTPKQTSIVQISYKLPFLYHLSDDLTIKSIFDKQVGSFSDKIVQKINVPDQYKLKSADPNEYNDIGNGWLEYDTILNSVKITDIDYAK